MHIIRCILNLGGGTQYHLMESPTPHSAQYQYQIPLQHAQLQRSLLSGHPFRVGRHSPHQQGGPPAVGSPSHGRLDRTNSRSLASMSCNNYSGSFSALVTCISSWLVIAVVSEVWRQW